MTMAIRADTTPRNLTHGEVAIREFTNTNLTPELSRRQAALLLNCKELLRNIRGLTPEDQMKFVEKVDQIYPTVDSQNVKSVTAFGGLCSAIERLPTPVVLSAGLNKRGDVAATFGGSTDTWRGEYCGAQVAIIAFRIHPAQKLKEAKEILWKRVPMWRKLSHENILSFRGVDMTLFQLALVYDWGQNGNINQYVASHPEASRSCLLFGVVKGLKYLHSLGISHGNLKGANVLVDQGGHARLAEYGLAPINSDPSLTVGATPRAVGISRWMAPEIIDPSRDANGIVVVESKPGDVFAFAMLAVEAFTGKTPFEELRNEAVVPWILEGGRPKIPKNPRAVGLTDEVWELLESCWQQNPKKRPTIEGVARRWKKFVGHNNDGDDMVTEKPSTTERPPGIRRLWARTGIARPPKKPKAPPFRSATVRLRTVSQTISIRTEVVRRGTMSEPIKPRTGHRAPPTPKRRNWLCGLF